MELNEPPLSDHEPIGSYATPPMYTGPAMQQGESFQPESTWPKVIGIISIVLGGLGMLGGFWQVVTPFFMKAIGDFLKKFDPSATDPFAGMHDWKYILAAVGVATFLIAVMLLIGGVQLLSRKRTSVAILKRWAIAKMIFSVIAIVVNFMLQMGQIQTTMQQASATAAGSDTVVKTAVMVGMVIGVLFGLAWAWAYPIFILFWFNKKNIQQEISTWDSFENNEI